MTLSDKAKKSTSLMAWRNYFKKGGSVKQIFLYIRSIFVNLVADEKKWTGIRHKNFFESIENYIKSGRKVLVLYGEKDTILIEEFEEKFAEITEGINHKCHKTVIPRGNHSFTDIETEKEAVRETLLWLNEWKEELSLETS